MRISIRCYARTCESHIIDHDNDDIGPVGFWRAPQDCKQSKGRENRKEGDSMEALILNKYSYVI